MKVLVTGGTGFLGGTIVRAFAARGHQTVVFARSAARAGLPGRAVAGDIRDRAALERAAAGCDAICHMAALVSLWRPRRLDFDDVNVGGLHNVLAVAWALRIRRILYTSSFLALPPADSDRPIASNDYQRTKLEAERIAAAAAAAGAPIVRLYPGVIYGPGPATEGNLVGRLIADHLAGRLPGVICPEQRWSYAYTSDLAAAYCAALEAGGAGARYILGGENRSQQELFAIVQAATGHRPPRRIPYEVAAVVGGLEECRARLLGGSPLLTRGTVEVFRHDWSLDSREAVRDLGYTITPLADGVRAVIAALEADAAARRGARRT